MNWNLIIGMIAGLTVSLIVFLLSRRIRKNRALRKGRRGERLVATLLSRLKRRDYLVLNNLLLPTADGHTSQIDHLVVSVRGIFVIETKSAAGRIVGSEHSQYWEQRSDSRAVSFYNPLLQNSRHVKVVARLLPDVPRDAIVSVIVFTQAWRLDIKADDIIIRRPLLPDRRISRTFLPALRRRRRWWWPGREVRLDEAAFVTGVEGVLDEIKRRPRIIPREDLKTISGILLRSSIKGREAMRAHTRYARQTGENISRGIRQGICPRCGASLVVRKGDAGEFIGCSSYPSCRFSCSIDKFHG